jgi:dihydropyrimidinase
MLIKNGMVVLENSAVKADIKVHNGKIIKIADHIEDDTDKKFINAENCYVLPGGIDVHTHLNLDVGIAVAQDDFYTGTVAAACGGTTTIVDHIGFGPEGCRLKHQIDYYHTLAENKAVIDYSFHGVIQHLDDYVLNDLEKLVQEGITSFKLYMTYSHKLSDEEIYRVLKKTKELGILVAVHPENHDIVTIRRKEFIEQGMTDPIYHERSRPQECEAEAINRIIQISSIAGDAPIYIVHLSNHLGMEYIRLGKEYGNENIFTETCPQYLMLDDSYYLREDGIKYILSPPLRQKINNELLWEDIITGEIDTIGTDHCPFDYRLKKQMGEHDFSQCPNGLPGIELRVPLIFSEGVLKNRITLNEFANLCSTKPAKLFGLYPQKGVIKEGSDADVVIIGLEEKAIITHDNLHENVDYTPYEGFEIQGKIKTVLSRGEVIVEDNSFNGKKGRGQFIKRKLPILN